MMCAFYLSSFFLGDELSTFLSEEEEEEEEQEGAGAGVGARGGGVGGQTCVHRASKSSSRGAYCGRSWRRWRVDCVLILVKYVQSELISFFWFSIRF